MTAMLDRPLHLLGLAEAARAIAAGTLTSEALTGHMLARIAEREPVSRAFVTVLADSARREAMAADAALAAGQPIGPLHGVPIAIKDLLETRGVRTTCGTRVLANWRPTRDATVVTRLRAAGAVIIGKTKLTEGAYGNHHPDVQPPVNPRRADLSPGVSSSGSGVAVADHLCFGALGTDTGGSIRFPSAFNGVVGLKPTYGRVSRHGCFPLAETLDHIGPMARSVEDAARLYAVLAGADPRDPTCLDAAAQGMPAKDVDAALAAPLAGLRIGFDATYARTGVAAAVTATLDAALARLAAAGAKIVPFRVPACDELVTGWAITASAEAALVHAQFYPARKADYGRAFAALLDLGRRAGGRDYAALAVLRDRFRGELQRAFVAANVDVLLCPAVPVAAPTIAEFAREVPEAEPVASYLTFTAPFNYSGHPTLTLPAGATADGRPLALQFVAGLAGEARLIRAGLAWEKVGTNA
jgi:amidase